MFGVRLGESIEPGSGLVEEVAAANEVAGLGRLVEEQASDLVVERRDQLLGGVRLCLERFKILGGEVVVAPIAQSL